MHDHDESIDAPRDEEADNGGSSAVSVPQQAEQGTNQHGYNLRPPKARDYTHLGHIQFVGEPTSTYRTIVTNLFSLTQMSFKKGLRKHGLEARKAMLKEFVQIKDKEVFSPVRASSLTPTERRKALRTINLIKEKRDGVLKGRVCVDGRPQRAYIAKEDASSPTISLDSLTALLTIFAVENRHVAVADVSGAYLHVDMDEGGYHSHRKTFWINVQSYGSKHSFLGMNIEFPGDGTVTIDTNNYFREVIEDFQREGHVIVGTNATPAAPNIFNTTRKNTPRSVEIADIFRSTVAKLLWASQRSRLDLSFAVTFLCSRLNCATEGDWEKLRKILGYLKGTIHMKRKLSGFNLHTMYTWVDASYAVHPDMRSHTGGALSFGVGALN